MVREQKLSPKYLLTIEKIVGNRCETLYKWDLSSSSGVHRPAEPYSNTAYTIIKTHTASQQISF